MNTHKPRVYIAGPITKGSRADNVARAVEVYRWLICAGFAPFCPHLSCYAEEGHGCQFDHETWLEVDLPWVAQAEVLLRLDGDSTGADMEVAHAKRNNVPVVYVSRKADRDAVVGAVSGAKRPDNGDRRFHAYLRAMGELHNKKQADYGRGKDPLANVRAAADFGVSAVLGVAIRMNDKLHRIKSFFQNGKLENESLRDSFLDLAVYSIIALILMDEQLEQAEDHA